MKYKFILLLLDNRRSHISVGVHNLRRKMEGCYFLSHVILLANRNTYIRPFSAFSRSL
jgi:hypothetical protein